MKNILLICFLALSVSGFGQSLKKKYLGTYEGTIPAYSLDLGESVVNVQPATIRIELTATTIVQTIGNVVQTGTWSILDSDQEVIVISFRPENSLIKEHITLYKKGKRLTRDGIYPQPSVELGKK